MHTYRKYGWNSGVPGTAPEGLVGGTGNELLEGRTIPTGEGSKED